jgi:hypothetical protein
MRAAQYGDHDEDRRTKGTEITYGSSTNPTNRGKEFPLSCMTNANG